MENQNLNANNESESSCNTSKCPLIKNRNKKLWGCGIALAVLGSLGIIGLTIVSFLVLISVSNLVWNDEEKEVIPEDIKSFDRDFIAGNHDSENIILTVPVFGIIHAGNEEGIMGDEGAAANKICGQLKIAAKNKDIKAVIIKIDSPGGEVVASDQIYNAIKNVRASGKPVIAQMNSLAASGGYYVAVGCDKIIAHPMTTTGSIGVIVQTYKYFNLFQKIGLESEPYTSGPMKDLLSGTRPTSIAEKELIQRHVNSVYDHFVKVCAEGRPGLTVEKIKTSQIGDGRIFLAAEAKKLGLIDQIGYFDDAEKKAASMANIASDYKVISLRRKFSLSSLFSANSKIPATNISVRLPGDLGNSNVKIEQGKFYFLPANL